MNIYYCSERGKYGVIPAGQKITIPLYYNWPYNSNDLEEYANKNFRDLYEFEIISQQYTGYNGNTPMNFYQDYFYENGYIIGSCPM